MCLSCPTPACSSSFCVHACYLMQCYEYTPDTLLSSALLYSALLCSPLTVVILHICMSPIHPSTTHSPPGVPWCPLVSPPPVPCSFFRPKLLLANSSDRTAALWHLGQGSSRGGGSTAQVAGGRHNGTKFTSMCLARHPGLPPNASLGCENKTSAVEIMWWSSPQSLAGPIGAFFNGFI